MRLRDGMAGRVASVAALLGLAGATGAGAAELHNWQIGLRDAASTTQAWMESFHTMLVAVITGITLFVLALLAYVMWRFNAMRHPTPSRTAHNTLIEVIWTVVPVLILLAIAVPSFRLLYYVDQTADPEMTLIAHGYQWYWGYEYPDQKIPEFQSYIVADDQLQPGQPRLLTTDNPVVLPIDTNIQILTTAGDVLHAWGMPAFGVKRDAVPGRLNETWGRIDREGIYYGQCYELCGTNHSYMPIEVHAVSREEFDRWVMEQVGPNPAEPPKLLTTTWEEVRRQRQLAQAAPQD